MLILAIETSCDETAASVINEDYLILSNVINTQIEEHKIYGGVVPEIASRRHSENITKVVSKAISDAGITLNDLDAIAVTYAPGLVGAVLVGVNFAKSLAFSLNKPLIPIHHLRGHIAANYLTHKELKPPFFSLVISGGHTHIVHVKDYNKFEIIGMTTDDAVGEAFDKVARVMGFPYPGGKYVDAAAYDGDATKYTLPTPKVKEKYNFSFSGVKTAVLNLINNTTARGEEIDVNSLSASFCKLISKILVDKTMSALADYNVNILTLAGGVCANSHIRRAFDVACQKQNVKLYYPELKYCTDNAAMIGACAISCYNEMRFAPLSLNAYSNMDISTDMY